MSRKEETNLKNSSSANPINLRPESTEAQKKPTASQNKVVTYAQLTSKASSSGAPNNIKPENKPSLVNSRSTTQPGSKNKNSRNSTPIPGESNKKTNSVLLPAGISEPSPVPGVVFGKTDKKPVEVNKNNPEKQSISESGGVPKNLPKVADKPIFRNTKRSESHSSNSENYSHYGTGPVPIPSSAPYTANKHIGLAYHFPDQYKNINDPKNAVHTDDNTANKHVHTNNIRPPHSKPYKQHSYYKGHVNENMMNKNPSSPVYYHNSNMPRVSFPEVNNEIPVNSSYIQGSEYMTNTVPLSSINIHTIHPQQRDVPNQGYSMPEPNMENQYFSSYPQQHPNSSHTSTMPRQQPHSIQNTSGMHYFPVSGNNMNQPRDKHIPISTVSGAQTNITPPMMHFQMPHSNNPIGNHLIPPIQPHANHPPSIPGPIQQNVNTNPQPLHNIPPGHAPASGFENPYIHNTVPPSYHHQNPNYNANQFVIPGASNTFHISQPPVISPGGPEGIIPHPPQSQSGVGIKPIPYNEHKVPFTNTLSSNSTEFAPKIPKSQKVKIFDPNTKSEVVFSQNPSTPHAETYPGASISTNPTASYENKHSYAPKETPLNVEASAFVPKNHNISSDVPISFVVPQGSKALKIVDPTSQKPKQNTQTDSTKPVQPQSDDNVKAEVEKTDTPPAETTSSTKESKDAETPAPPKPVEATLDSKEADESATIPEKESLPVEKTEAASSTPLDQKEVEEKLPQTSSEQDTSNKTQVDDTSSEEQKESESKEQIQDSTPENPSIVNTSEPEPELETDTCDQAVAPTEVLKIQETESVKLETARILDELNNEVKPANVVHKLTLDEIKNSITYPQSIKNMLSSAPLVSYVYPMEFVFALKDLVKKKPKFINEITISEEKSGGGNEGRRMMSRHRSDIGRERGSGRSSMGMQGVEMGVFKHSNRSPNDKYGLGAGQMGIGGFHNIGLGNRTSSSGGMIPRGSKLNQSGRHRNRDTFDSGMDAGSSSGRNQNFKPLPSTPNGWKRSATIDDKQAVLLNPADITDELVERKVKSLLNKLTVDNFDSISPEVVEWANKSVDEEDGRIIGIVLNLVFEKATDEPPFAGMYAKLSKLIHDNVSPDLAISTHVDRSGNSIKGTMVVRRILINRCQKTFEAGWKVEIPDDIKSDEYYDAMKIKRRGLGLIKFIGELYLRSLISEKILRGAIEYLLNLEKEDETLESLAKLITTVGFKLDKDSGAKFLDDVFMKIKALSTDKSMSSRIRFTFMDVLDLRTEKWKSKINEVGPMEISKIHEEVEKEKMLASSMRRGLSSGGRGQNMQNSGRIGSRSGDRSSQGNYKGFRNDNQPNRNAGDLSNFGNLSRSKAQLTGSLGPNTSFNLISQGAMGWKSAGNDSRGRKNESRSYKGSSTQLNNAQKTQRKESVSLTKQKSERSSNVNIFETLSSFDDTDAHLAPSSEAQSAGAKAIVENEGTGLVIAPGEPEKEKATMNPPLPESVIKRKTKAILDEFLSINDIHELVYCVKDLGAENLTGFISQLIYLTIEKNPVHVSKVVAVFGEIIKDAEIPKDSVISGFSSIGDLLEDLVADAPLCLDHFSSLLSESELSISEVKDCFGALATSNSLAYPQIKLLGLYLDKMNKKLELDEVVNLIQGSENNQGLNIVDLLPSDKQSEENVKKILDSKSLLKYFKA
ncbi:hypothetical protein BB560_000031, partial [Smittium megazygosporum]